MQRKFVRQQLAANAFDKQALHYCKIHFDLLLSTAASRTSLYSAIHPYKSYSEQISDIIDCLSNPIKFALVYYQEQQPFYTFVESSSVGILDPTLWALPGKAHKRPLSTVDNGCHCYSQHDPSLCVPSSSLSL